MEGLKLKKLNIIFTENIWKIKLSTLSDRWESRELFTIDVHLKKCQKKFFKLKENRNRNLDM